MLDYLCIIQARLNSTRFPNKVMQTVKGRTMVKRVWDAAKQIENYYGKSMKVIVAWPERYPDLDENDVLSRFWRLINEFQPEYVIRLTADCPLITHFHIRNAIIDSRNNRKGNRNYYCNHRDGYDVQIFNPWVDQNWHKEHVIADFNTPSTGLSVNTKEDLERVRRYIDIDKVHSSCEII